MVFVENLTYFKNIRVVFMRKLTSTIRSPIVPCVITMSYPVNHRRVNRKIEKIISNSERAKTSKKS